MYPFNLINSYDYEICTRIDIVIYEKKVQNHILSQYLHVCRKYCFLSIKQNYSIKFRN